MFWFNGTFHHQDIPIVATFMENKSDANTLKLNRQINFIQKSEKTATNKVNEACLCRKERISNDSNELSVS